MIVRIWEGTVMRHFGLWKHRNMPGRRTVVALVMGMVLASSGPAQAAGKPEKKYLEGKFHMMITGLRTFDENSRAAGNILWAEHPRDVRALPDLLRYTQSAPLPFYDLRSSFDSVTELWFPTFEKAQGAWASDAMTKGAIQWSARIAGGQVAGGRQPWRPDSEGFVFVQDHVMVDGYEQGYKWFSFMRRKPGVSAKQAQDYFLKTYAPALAKLPGVRRYVIGTTIRPQGADKAKGIWAAPQKWDAVDMIWFATLEDMRSFFALVDYQENVLRPAEAAIVDPSQTVSFATEYNERVPFPPRYDGPRFEEMGPAPRREEGH